jgi:hypothetical protein
MTIDVTSFCTPLGHYAADVKRVRSPANAMTVEGLEGKYSTPELGPGAPSHLHATTRLWRPFYLFAVWQVITPVILRAARPLGLWMPSA